MDTKTRKAKKDFILALINDCGYTVEDAIKYANNVYGMEGQSNE